MGSHTLIWGYEQMIELLGMAWDLRDTSLLAGMLVYGSIGCIITGLLIELRG